MTYVENNDINDLIKEGVHVIDFYATWCGPCKMLEPVLEELENNTDIDIIKVDIDKNQKLTYEYRILSVPTLVFVKDGKTVEELIGFHDKYDIEDIYKRLVSKD